MQRISALCACLLTTSLGACKRDGTASKPNAASRPSTPSKSAPKPKTPDFYVQASTLRLRAGPDTASKTKGRLRINYGVDILEEKNGFARVKTLNGGTGWVGRKYLAPKRLRRDTALSKAKSATVSASRLSWLQRAAAIAPRDLGVLGELAAAYDETKNPRAASMVRSLIKTLKTSWYPIVPGKGVRIEWWDYTEPTTPRNMPTKDWSWVGLSEDVPIWVLFDVGAARRVTIKSADVEIRNECAGESGVDITLNAPHKGRPLVATTKKPPSSWLIDLPHRDGEVAEKAFAKFATEIAEKGDVKKSFFFDGEHFTGFVAVREEEFKWRTHRTRWSSEGKKLGGEVKVVEEMFVEVPFARRDIDGDGSLEEISSDECATYIRKDGAVMAKTSFRCCGC